jgi:hypothetical protein
MTNFVPSRDFTYEVAVKRKESFKFFFVSGEAYFHDDSFDHEFGCEKSESIELCIDEVYLMGDARKRKVVFEKLPFAVRREIEDEIEEKLVSEEPNDPWPGEGEKTLLKNIFSDYAEIFSGNEKQEYSEEYI